MLTAKPTAVSTLSAEQAAIPSLASPVTEAIHGSPFKVGDRVLIAEKDVGWSYWVNNMDKTVDTTATVTEIDSRDFIHLDNSWFYRTEVIRHADYKGESAVYEPAPGDVVEFDRKGKACKGIVFNSQASGVLVVNNIGYPLYCNNLSHLDECGVTMTRTGYIAKAVNVQSLTEAKEMFESYFSTPKSYTERQAAWVKENGVKVGSKVKVVRKFEENEDGCSCRQWDNSEWKQEMQGGTYEICRVENTRIVLRVLASSHYVPGFPYTALEVVK